MLDVIRLRHKKFLLEHSGAQRGYITRLCEVEAAGDETKKISGVGLMRASR